MGWDGLSAQEVIARLALAPHPEGGHFRETFRDARRTAEGRSVSTAIYYLLNAGEVSHWHRVDAVEVWHWYAGAPLELRIALEDAGPIMSRLLGPGMVEGEEPQHIVPQDAWQSARSCGEWTLIGCTVAPGFEFAGFELAAPGWSPG